MKYLLLHIKETEKIESKLLSTEINNSLQKFIVTKIKNSYIHNITEQNNLIKFKAPVFRFVWNGFNLFNPITKGSVEFSIKNNIPYLSYHFFFTEFFIYALIFSSIPIFSIYFAMVYKIISLLIIWIIYFISTMLAAHRFENTVKNFLMELEINRKKIKLI